MKALQFRRSIPRYVILKLLGSRFRGLCTGAASPVALRDVPEPTLPTPQWARVRPRLAGICGSDLATICAKGSAYLAPVTSMPFVMGHEVVGTVSEVGAGVRRVRVGDRVVLHPALGCKAREISPPCATCSEGRDALCRNVTRGIISKGIQIGYCRDTGGGFGENFVAHESQLHVVPAEIDDRAAVLIEPFACALHGALRAAAGSGDTVLVIGAGAIGLLTVAALRATGCAARIVVAAKYDHQRRHALALGADAILEARGSTRERYAQWSAALDAEALKPEWGKPTVLGGAAATFDCVASSDSIDDGLRFTRSGGTFVLVGMPGMPRGVDWTPMWFKELDVHAAYAYGPERLGDGQRETFDLAIDLMRNWGARLSVLLGPPFPLEAYRQALGAALHTGRSGAAKTVFAIEQG
jgi:threonine dehydrogenase-like Zn-dependent dehydrogenase